MKRIKSTRLTAKSLWKSAPIASKNMDLILGSLKNLHLRYWRDNFFFKGAPDSELIHLTKGFFPRDLIPYKTHPIFSLQKLPDYAGFRVCPCSTRKFYHRNAYRYLKKGCVLKHTGKTLDRDSRLVESIYFNIPQSFASRLRFFGEVPETCIAHNNVAINS